MSIWLRLGFLEAKPEAGILVQVSYWGSTPRRGSDGRMGDKPSKEVVSGGDSLNLIPQGAPEQELHQPWSPLRPGQSWDSGEASEVFAGQHCTCPGACWRIETGAMRMERRGWLWRCCPQSIRKGLSQKFPSGPVVRTLCFHCRGHRFDL